MLGPKIRRFEFVPVDTQPVVTVLSDTLENVSAGKVLGYIQNLVLSCLTQGTLVACRR